MGFPSLPNLPSLSAFALPVQSQASIDLGKTATDATNNLEASGGLEDIAGSVADAATKSFLGGVSLVNIITITVGLILILAGVLSFKSSRDVIVSGVKTAATA